MTAKLSKKTGLPRPIETTGRTWQLRVAGEILRTLDDCGLPTPASQLGQNLVMTWRYHHERGDPAHCCLRITVRPPDHEVPIEISGGGMRQAEWRPDTRPPREALVLRMRMAAGDALCCSESEVLYLFDKIELLHRKWKDQR
jgi:hypothetical protein